MSSRAGSILLETLVAITLIALALSGVSQLLLIAGQQQRVIERRRLASREAGNVMEQVMLRGFAELTTDGLTGLTMAPDVQQQLPGSALQVEVTPLSEPVSARQVQVQISWRNRAGLREQVQLVAWKTAVSP